MRLPLLPLTIPAVLALTAGCSSSKQTAPTITATTTTTTTTSSAPTTSSSSSNEDAGPEVLTDFCSGCAPSETTGQLQNDEITETSGLVASQVHQGVLYVHNDSGDSARFFAIDRQGADLGLYELSPPITAIDWEDAALGRRGDDSCLFLGDIGDNLENRQQYEVLRVVEPSSVSAGVHSVSYERLPFQYPDGSHNAETLLAHPQTGELWIVTKVASGPSGIYRFPASNTPGELMTLTKVGELQPPTGIDRFTGGDIHPKGQGLLLRTYTHGFYYAIAGAGVEGALLEGDGCSVPVAFELQGETIAFSAAGDGFLTVSEGGGSSIHAASCAVQR